MANEIAYLGGSTEGSDSSLDLSFYAEVTTEVRLDFASEQLPEAVEFKWFEQTSNGYLAPMGEASAALNLTPTALGFSVSVPHRGTERQSRGLRLLRLYCDSDGNVTEYKIPVTIEIAEQRDSQVKRLRESPVFVDARLGSIIDWLDLFEVNYEILDLDRLRELPQDGILYLQKDSLPLPNNRSAFSFVFSSGSVTQAIREVTPCHTEILFFDTFKFIGHPKYEMWLLDFPPLSSASRNPQSSYENNGLF